jgi:hypothetical protein
MPTDVEGDFEWDRPKARANIRKHGVSFREAATALADPRTVLYDDAGVLKAIGLSRRGRLLTVAHEARGERERIISAWLSTPAERRHWISERGK